LPELKPQIPTPEQIPPILHDLSTWICWRPSYDETSRKFKKLPISPHDGRALGATQKNAQHFATFDIAREYALTHDNVGVSFVFLAGGEFTGIDLDHCYVDGALDPVAVNWLKFFPTYAEKSPSGTGLHIIIRGKLDRVVGGVPLPGAPGVTVECYCANRHLTFTGESVNGVLDVVDCQTSLAKLLAHLNVKTSAPETATEGALNALPVTIIRALHAKHLEELAKAIPGSRNNALNTAAYFAGRAQAAGTLKEAKEATLEGLKTAAGAAWSGSIPLADMNTLETAWATGLKAPLTVAVDEASQSLDEFNERFFVVGAHGSKCRVGSLEVDPIFYNRLTLNLQAFPDFRNWMDNVKLQVGEKADGTPILKGRASYWLEHPHRRTYERIVFDPSQAHESPEVLNLWRGFAIEPRKGDCARYLDHLHEVICCGSDDLHHWYVGQLAYWVQFPGEPGHVCIVHRGEEGTGKSTAADAYGELFGSHFLTVVKSEQLTGRFNRHFLDACVIHANEALYAGAKSHAAALKALITDPILQIEAKGIDLVQAKNCIKLMISSNERWVVPASLDARRFAVFNVSNKRQKQFEYFEKIWKEMRNGGRGALLYHLLNLDLSQHNARQAPKTLGLDEQKAMTLEGAEKAWYECLVRGELPGIKERDGYSLRSKALIEWSDRVKEWRWAVTSEQTGLLFGLNPRGSHLAMGFKKLSSPRRWGIPALRAARLRWEELRFQGAWRNNPEWETEEWECLSLGGMDAAAGDDIF
jgi:uncharacterized protein DUF5906